MFISPNNDYNYPININNTNGNKNDKLSKKYRKEKQSIKGILKLNNKNIHEFKFYFYCLN